MRGVIENEYDWPGYSESAEAEISQVLPGLYVGSGIAAQSLDSSALGISEKISHVLNCSKSPNAPDAHRKYLRLNLSDSSADLHRMGEAIRQGVSFIHDAMQKGGGAVLVHCNRGISRSCTLVMAYLIWSKGQTADDAFVQLRKARPICDPNLGFRCVLKEWEEQVQRDPRSPSSQLLTSRSEEVSPEPPTAVLPGKRHLDDDGDSSHSASPVACRERVLATWRGEKLRRCGESVLNSPRAYQSTGCVPHVEQQWLFGETPNTAEAL